MGYVMCKLIDSRQTTKTTKMTIRKKVEVSVNICQRKTEYINIKQRVFGKAFVLHWTTNGRR